MDTESNSTNIAQSPPPLDSDQLNYLIWRYLQEAGYAEAAVKLQRDWKVDIESLPFAKNIKGRALVHLVQKGLRYHHLSLQFDENGQQTKALVPSMFFFGPESVPTDSVPTQKENLLKVSDPTRGVSPASTIANASRPKVRESNSVVPDESAPQVVKRGRKPAHTLPVDRNGLTTRKVSGATEPDVTNGIAVQQTDINSSSPAEDVVEDVPMTNGHHDDRMDLDNEAAGDSGDVLMEEQSEEPLAPLVPTLTNGESVAVQVAPAKVSNLRPTSAILSLEATQSIQSASWRPTDAATLVAQSDTFCGFWNLTGQDLLPDSVKPLPSSFFPTDGFGMVTATAWTSDGSVLAVATSAEEESQIHLFDGQDLTLIESLPASQRAIIKLRWHPSGNRLTGSSLNEDMNSNSSALHSTLLSWDFSMGQGTPAPSSLTIPSTIHDIDCAKSPNNSIVYVAAENAVYRCQGLRELSISQQWTSEALRAKQNWAFIRCAQRSIDDHEVVAATAESAALWLPSLNLLKENAHSATLTGLEIRPRRHSAHGSYPTLEFATASEDGSIRVWQTNRDRTALICSHQLRPDPLSHVMSLSYSPDGFCLSAASYAYVRIWHAEHGYSMTASWEGVEPEWRGSSINDDDLASAAGKSSVNGDSIALGAQHTLTWHTDSKRLAFGLGSQVAVINLQR